MHPVQFGYCVPTFAWPGGRLFRTPNLAALDVGAALHNAQLADELGYDSIWVADHLMLGQDQAILEGWTILAAIAGATRHARLGMIHQAHYFRHPAVAAKMTATLDQITGGRVIFFADSGTRGEEHHAYGLNYPAAKEARMDDFLEGLDLTLRLWQSGPANPLTYDGRFYHLRGAVCTPPPVTEPHPPIWFGEAHPLTLDACARLGQGWNSTPVGLAELDRRLGALRLACQQAGRPMAELEISYETQILIAPSREAVRERLGSMLALTPPGAESIKDADFLAFVNRESDTYPRALTDTGLVGTGAEIVSQLRAYQDSGVTHFMLWFMDAPLTQGMRLFMEQVVPAMRAGLS
jgi:alkanesulfonate monooxygenase SsuD/methylene tetrahydromethanopterin reductase-like flavin-dependent oxidoreductase (luciferase family)